MNKLEKDLNELLELSEQERFKPSPELLACGRLEKQNANTVKKIRFNKAKSSGIPSSFFIL